jgi:hypothetical protein
MLQNKYIYSIRNKIVDVHFLFLLRRRTMNKEILSINPIDDHNVKFNITKDRLNDANDAIRNLSKARKEESGVEVEIVDDKILHKRKESDYELIYSKFLSEEVNEFKEAKGFGVEEIEKIGVKKFIDANDWRSEEDVKKWQTDPVGVIVCLHCENDFAPLDMIGRLECYGVCSKCAKLFDLERINVIATFESSKDLYDDIADPSLRFLAGRIRVMEQFVVDKDFRDHLLRKRS